jgi:hypothetical protein
VASQTPAAPSRLAVAVCSVHRLKHVVGGLNTEWLVQTTSCNSLVGNSALLQYQQPCAEPAAKRPACTQVCCMLACLCACMNVQPAACMNGHQLLWGRHKLCSVLDGWPGSAQVSPVFPTCAALSLRPGGRRGRRDCLFLRLAVVCEFRSSNPPRWRSRLP